MTQACLGHIVPSLLPDCDVSTEDVTANQDYDADLALSDTPRTQSARFAAENSFRARGVFCPALSTTLR